jgi:hypothetical protein
LIGNVTKLKEIRNAYRILEEKPLQKHPTGRMGG